MQKGKWKRFWEVLFGKSKPSPIGGRADGYNWDKIKPAIDKGRRGRRMKWPKGDYVLCLPDGTYEYYRAVLRTSYGNWRCLGTDYVSTDWYLL